MLEFLLLEKISLESTKLNVVIEIQCRIYSDMQISMVDRTFYINYFPLRDIVCRVALLGRGSLARTSPNPIPLTEKRLEKVLRVQNDVIARDVR